MGATGSKPAVVALLDDRVVELYAMESPEPWFEDLRECRVAGWALSSKLMRKVNGLGMPEGFRALSKARILAVLTFLEGADHTFISPYLPASPLRVLQKM